MILRLLTFVFALGLICPLPSEGQILRNIRRAAGNAAARVAERSSAADSLREAAARAGGALGAQAGGSTSAGGTADFRALRELLPDAFAGFRRTNATGQRSSAMGIATSSAEGTYEKGEASAQVTITDMGTMRGFAALGAAWMNVEIDNETDNGFERTLQYRDYKAHAAEDREARTGEMTVVVGERFVVKAEVDGGDARMAQAALDAVDLGRLAAMAGPPVRAVEGARLAQALPGTLGGHSQASIESSTTSVLGFNTSTATAVYGRGADAVTVTITDYMGGAALASFAWVASTYDNQTERGFERTARYEGHPAFEREERSGSAVSSALQVVVGNRFWIEVKGDVPFAQLRAALGGLDLAGIRALGQ